MSVLPVPADQYFDDFAFDLEDYQIIRKGEIIATVKGLSNSSYGQQFVSFLFGVDIQPGDMLESNSCSSYVSRIEHDTYNGEKQLTNAFLR